MNNLGLSFQALEGFFLITISWDFQPNTSFRTIKESNHDQYPYYSVAYLGRDYVP